MQYDRLVESALKDVVRAALRIVEKHGLVGSHHFYITFRTQMPGVSVPDYLREKYPDEMTIVLQYQFYNLEITEEKFSVSLSFNNVQEHLEVPFAAVTGFADPSVKFGLQFHSHEDLFEEDGDEAGEIMALAALSDEELEEEENLLPDEDLSENIKSAKSSDQTDNVVSLDSFRKKP